jgi:DNA-binding SARP family transcriptional activator/TolB-like protein
MIRLRTLGALDLQAAGGDELRAVLAQPKRLALLAYLAIAAPGGFVRRDTLLAVFWPESDEERARGAFRQAVRYLRRSLGDDVIVNRGADEVGIAEDTLWCDATAFRRALAEGDLAAALDLYRGDLLEGFYVPDAPGFERWLEAERTALRERAAAAALTLADECETTGDLADASRWARRALELAPFDEGAARRLILLLDRSGDRAGAVTTFETFARTLERELDLEPSPETVALVEAVRERTGDGASRSEAPPFLVQPPLEILPTSGDGAGTKLRRDPEPPTTLPLPVPASPRRHLRLATLGGLALLVATITGILAYAYLWPTHPSQAAQPVMVMPFENRTGDEALDPLSDMAADWITQGIAQTGAFEVVPATAVLTARRHVDAASRAQGQSGRLRSLVRETGARSLVTGSYFRQRDSLFFHAQVTRARDGRVLAAVERVGVPAEAPLEGVDQVRRRLLAAMAPLDDVPTHARAAVTPPTYEAYRAYVAGMEAFVRLDFPGALQHYGRASAADDSYPMPLLGSAIAHMNLGNLATGDSIARRVEAFRGQLGPLEEITLDLIQAWLRGDDAAAYDAMVRHRRIAPGTIGHYQVAEQARRLNRPRETIRVLRDLGPERGELRGWVVYWRELTAAHHMLGQHRRELSAARRARALYVDHPLVLRSEARALAALGRTSEVDAVVHARLASPRTEGPSPGLLMTLAANDLRAYGHVDAAAALHARAIAWYHGRPADEQQTSGHRRALAFAHYAAGRWDEAETLYRQLASEDPASLSVLGYLGLLAARRGGHQEAEQIAEQLAQWDMPYHRHVPMYWRAGIAAQLGQPERAVALLQEAFSQGMQHGPWHRTDMDLDPLRDYPPFRELMRPKG